MLAEKSGSKLIIVPIEASGRKGGLSIDITVSFKISGLEKEGKVSKSRRGTKKEETYGSQGTS